MGTMCPTPSSNSTEQNRTDKIETLSLQETNPSGEAIGIYATQRLENKQLREELAELRTTLAEINKVHLQTSHSDRIKQEEIESKKYEALLRI